MRVTLITPSLDHPIDHYRGFLPLQKANDAGKCELTTRTISSVIIDARIDPAGLEKDLTADVIVVRGTLSFQAHKSIRDIHKALGSPSKIVYDYDDNPFAVSPFNQSYEHSGTEEVTFTLPDGSKMPMWIDGKTIDIRANQRKKAYLKDALREADMLTTTTEALAQVLRQYNSTVKVLPNCLDLSKFQKLDFPKKEVRVLWTGSASHYEDVLVMKPVFEKMLETFPQVKLVIVGYTPPGMKKTIPADRVEYHSWDHVAAYPYRLAILNADIALIPLRGTEFNRCKSPLKFLEMSALGIPSILSYVTPYRELIEQAGTDDIGMFVDGFEPQQWIDALDILIGSPVMCDLMGKAARGFVEQNFDINKRCGEWIKAYSGQFQMEAA